MSNSISILWACRQAAVLMTLVLAGCDDFDDSPVQPTGVEDAADRPALMPLVASTEATDERPGEATFVEIAAVEPNFAGFFVDGDELVVLATSGAVGSTGAGGNGDGGGPGDLLTDDGVGSTGATDEVPAEVEASLRELVSGAPGHDVSSVSVRVAEYSFLQLSAWRDQLDPTIWSSDDVRSLDLDERFNRLTVELETGTGEAEIRAAAQLLGVPDAALGFEVSGAVALTASVRGRTRPVRGGYYISTREHDGCTYGFNAVRAINGDTVAVTNSHCTNNMFQFDGDSVWQQDKPDDAYGDYASEDFIGFEISDPGPIPCTARRGACRYDSRRSDAAAIHLELPADSIGLYQIARTIYGSPGTVVPPLASFVISPTNPYFTIIGEWPSPTEGSELNKIGVTTGWTYGVVIKTCADRVVQRRVGDDIKITCAYKMNARSEGGDSGSPVFYWNGDGDGVVLAGLLFGGDTSSYKAWFSSMAAIEHDLGSLRTADPNAGSPLTSVAITGPVEVKPEQGDDECLWHATVSGGYGALSYQWERDGVAVGSNSSDYFGDTGSADFLLEITVTDVFDNSVQDALFVEVDSGASSCL